MDVFALYLLFLCFFFFKQKTAYEMRISDWSSDVCSSDLLLVIPLGLVGAVLAVTLRGLENDVYMQIGLLTTMGLAAKNAILMIEFAEQQERQGKRVIEAAIRSEEHTSELQSLMRISYAVFCLKKNTVTQRKHQPTY